jgi:hypothetical protein
MADMTDAHPPSWTEVFGEDLGPSMITDDPHTAPPRSSAAIMAKRRRDRDREAAQERDMAQLQAVAQDEADDQALAEALRLARKGKKIPADLLAGAMRAARARGTAMSSAEIMAAQAQVTRRREALKREQAHEEAQRGRRPLRVQ